MTADTRVELDARTIEALQPPCQFSRGSEFVCGAAAEWALTFNLHCGCGHRTGLYCTPHKDEWLHSTMEGCCPRCAREVDADLERMERL